MDSVNGNINIFLHKNMIMKKLKTTPPITITTFIKHNSVAERGNQQCIDAYKINSLVWRQLTNRVQIESSY
jgi:hypothetical protein